MTPHTSQNRLNLLRNWSGTTALTSAIFLGTFAGFTSANAADDAAVESNRGGFDEIIVTSP